MSLSKMFLIPLSQASNYILCGVNSYPVYTLFVVAFSGFMRDIKMRQMANSGDTKSMQLVKHFMFVFSVYGVVDGFSCLFVPTKNSITVVTDHPSDVFFSLQFLHCVM